MFFTIYNGMELMVFHGRWEIIGYGIGIKFYADMRYALYRYDETEETEE